MMKSNGIKIATCTICLLALMVATLSPVEVVSGAGDESITASKAIRQVNAQVKPKAYEPKIAKASDEGEKAIAGFQVPEGFKVELFAAEPSIANPVAFHIDTQGRIFVAETFRQGDQGGVVDNRGHMYWLDDDLAAMTVEDRRKYFIKNNKKDVERWSTQHDRIRLLVDADRDGKADQATVFSDGYNDLVDGTGAGLLAWRGNVYYTCIPKVYRLRDDDGDGVANKKDVLSEGYGIKVAYRGHDLHGVTMGPDGRIYYSIGDRGYHVKTKEGKMLTDVNAGAVFRCEPDGSNLEVVYRGLRNPQELAFDDYGNLFTGDNNSDSVDKARFTWIVKGGDTGWRMSYQYLRDRGPWNREGWWHLWTPKHAAFITPPLAHIASGPSGLAHYPGTGLPDSYAGTFFLCDFRGGAGTSGVHTFKVSQKGAGFEVVNRGQFVWRTLVTDVDFGYDGAVYFTDWVHGWNGLGKGRVYRVFNPSTASSVQARQVRAIFKRGMGRLPLSQLVKLMSHLDRRVRQEAHFVIADGEHIDALTKVLAESKEVYPRLHAIWALEIIARRGKQPVSKKALESVLAFAGDTEVKVRQQVAKVFADHSYPALSTFVAMLADEDDHVRLYAAYAVGQSVRGASGEKIGVAVKALSGLLQVNDSKDPFLRHAGVMGLTYVGKEKIDALLVAAASESRSVRMGVLLALRRLRDSRIAKFLSDVDPDIVTEAARAINDMLIDEALPQLASTLSNEKIVTLDPFLRRAINAAYVLGGKKNAQAVAQFALREDMPSARREGALDALKNWAGKSSRDRVLGMWRPVRARLADEAAAVSGTVVVPIVKGDTVASVKLAAIELVAVYKLQGHGDLLLSVVKNVKEPSSVRQVALRVLGELKDKQLQAAVSISLSDNNTGLRGEARKWLAKLKPSEAVPVLEAVLVTGELSEKQSALTVLANMKNNEADALLLKWLDELIKGHVPLELQLDVLESIKRRNTPRMKLKLAVYESSLPAKNAIGHFAHLAKGGDVASGKKIFWTNAKASCQRCHKVGKQGAGEAGPNLAGLGSKQKSSYFVESILFPNKQITKGFDSVDIETLDGDRLIGVIKEETKKAVTIVTPQNKRVTVLVSDIVERRKSKSAMPEDIFKDLTSRQVRDLVAYLASLK